MAIFDNRTILITGGTGSFGKEFVSRMVSAHSPRKVIVYSRDELKQFEMSQNLDHRGIRYLIGDVRDKDRLKFAMKNVDFVVHAAALKQVPAAEYNPMECIKTNIHGAENVVEAALATGVERVIALSTDKAVNPINLYGATKLASDKLFIAANNTTGKLNTRFSIVRYGNVMGSRGSVIPFFRKLIDNGAASLPITDKRMTRFWITLDYGVDFVIESFTNMLGGEVLVPKLPSVKIVDLARALAPGLPIQEIGRRPGEKIHEVLCPRDDSHLTLEFKNYFLIRPGIKFYDVDVDYSTNFVGEKSSPVHEDYEYDSGTNEEFLDIERLKSGINATLE
jgi:UDP-N-acetylglucosamine 4,6-dehydratase/5-epimerase